jgi:hypothetical protein
LCFSGKSWCADSMTKLLNSNSSQNERILQRQTLL